MGLGSIGTHQALVSSSRNFLVRRRIAVRPKMERTFPCTISWKHTARVLFFSVRVARDPR
jgi:hypothetical protein